MRDVEKTGLHRDGERWLSEAGRHMLAVLSDGREATSSELRDEIPRVPDAHGAAPYELDDLVAARGALLELVGQSASPEHLSSLGVREHRDAPIRRPDDRSPLRQSSAG